MELKGLGKFEKPVFAKTAGFSDFYESNRPSAQRGEEDEKKTD